MRGDRKMQGPVKANLQHRNQSERMRGRERMRGGGPREDAPESEYARPREDARRRANKGTSCLTEIYLFDNIDQVIY
jgi:hypothetical protein